MRWAGVPSCRGLSLMSYCRSVEAAVRCGLTHTHLSLGTCCEGLPRDRQAVSLARHVATRALGSATRMCTSRLWLLCRVQCLPGPRALPLISGLEGCICPKSPERTGGPVICCQPSSSWVWGPPITPALFNVGRRASTFPDLYLQLFKLNS